MALLSADSFNRANGHPGSTDGAGFFDPLSWEVYNATTGALLVGSSGDLIVSNRLQDASAGSIRAVALLEQAPARDSTMTVGVFPSLMDISDAAGVACAVNDDGQDHFRCEILSLGGVPETFRFQLRRRMGGSESTLNFASYAPVDGDIIGIRIDGTFISGYLNEVEVLTATDANLSGNSRFGVYLRSVSAVSSVDNMEVNGTNPDSGTSGLGVGYIPIA